MAEQEARGHGELDGQTLAETIAWYRQTVGQLKRLTSTQKGNITRVEEGLGDKITGRLTAADVIEHVRRRIKGEHFTKDGKLIPPCGPATMNARWSHFDRIEVGCGQHSFAAQEVSAVLGEAAVYGGLASALMYVRLGSVSGLLANDCVRPKATTRPTFAGMYTSK